MISLTISAMKDLPYHAAQMRDRDLAGPEALELDLLLGVLELLAELVLKIGLRNDDS